MLKEMSYGALLEWRAYDALEPIGGVRSDWQIASVCATLWNIAAVQAGSKKRFTPKEFLLEFGEGTKEGQKTGPPRQSWQQQRLIGMMMAATAKAEEKNKGKRRRR